jgi:hypothetical protein
MRHLASLFAAVWLVIASAGVAFADTQGGNPTHASGDNTWLAIVALVLLVASLIVVRPRRRP